MDDHNPVGLKIKELRIKRGLNQSDTADIFSVSPSTISHWENGKRLPSIIELQKIADYYQVPFHIFGSGDDFDFTSLGITANSDAQTQSIQISSFGYQTHPIIIVLQGIAGIFLIASVMMNDIIGQILFALAGLGILAVVITFLAKDYVTLKSSPRQWTVPIHLKFRYEQSAGEHTIKVFKKKLLTMSLISIITTTFVIICATQSILQSHRDISTLFLSFMGFVIVGMTYARYEMIKRSKVISKQIPYNEAPSRLRLRILGIVWLADLIVLIGVGIHMFLQEGTFIPAFLGCALTLALVNATISLIILIEYKSFLMGFSVCTTDQHGKTVRMK